MSAKPRLAYLVMRFPLITETFILREMVELERQGRRFDFFVVIREHEKVVHPDARSFLARMQWSPSLAPRVLVANLRVALRSPLRYLSLWIDTLRMLWGSWYFLARDLYLLPKSVCYALDMKRRGISHVHAHFGTHTAYMTWVIRRVSGIGYSFTTHAADIYLNRAMLREKMQDARFVATISEFNRELLASECGEDLREKVHVVRCGVFPARFQPRQRPPREPGAPYRVLTVASLRDYKGLTFAIEACALLRERIPELRWEVIGEGPDRAALERAIAERGVGEHFVLAGAQPEDVVAGRMRETDAFVLPSIVMPNGRMEGVPVALMEALATEVPTISTRISGIPELVIDGETGRLVPEQDAEALADALCDLHRDPEAARALAVRGRQLVLAEFTIEGNATRLGQHFDEVLERAASQPTQPVG